MKRREFLKDIAVAGASLAAVSCAGGAARKVASSSLSPAAEGTGEMEYRINPKQGDKVSLLGYGCMRWPMKDDPNGSGKKIVDQEKVNALVDKAFEGGINFFDMSPAYLQGQCEKATGIALARHPRDSYFVSTKLSNFGDHSYEASIKMYHDSFKEIGVDYFDYYLLHSIGRPGPSGFHGRYVENGVLDFLLKEREKGKIRNLGFSFHGSQAAFEELIATHEQYHWDFVLIQMNYMDWKHADGVNNANAEYVYNELVKRGIPMLVMEPLQGGRLSRVPEHIAVQFKEREPQRSIPSWAFRFVGTQPGVLSLLSGMTYMEHLEDNLSSFVGFKPLSDSDLAFIDDIADNLAIFQKNAVNCNDCKYCMPCPYGVDIPGIFRHYNDSITSGSYVQGKEQEGYARLRRRYLASYDKAIETLRQANHCIGCGKCLEHCPQSIDIPSQLHRIDRYVEKLKRETI